MTFLRGENVRQQAACEVIAGWRPAFDVLVSNRRLAACVPQKDTFPTSESVMMCLPLRESSFILSAAKVFVLLQYEISRTNKTLQL